METSVKTATHRAGIFTQNLPNPNGLCKFMPRWFSNNVTSGAYVKSFRSTASADEMN
jgi:hypothetical protein